VYRDKIKDYHPKLVAQMTNDQSIRRDFIPTTFDEMMVDFGGKLHREQLIEHLDKQQV